MTASDAAEKGISVRAEVKRLDDGSFVCGPLEIAGDRRADVSAVAWPSVTLNVGPGARALYSETFGAQGNLRLVNTAGKAPGKQLFKCRNSPGFRFAAVIGANGDSFYLGDQQNLFSFTTEGAAVATGTDGQGAGAPVYTEENKPISMWGYVGWEIVFALPLVGLILAIVFSFGGTHNINLKNFARGKFALWIIGIAVGLIIFLIVRASIMSAFGGLLGGGAGMLSLLGGF